MTIGDLRCDRPFFIEVIAKPEPANRHRFNVAAKNILSVGVGIMVKTAATHLDVGHPFRIGTLHEVPADEKVPADKIGGWTFEELAAHSFHQELEVAAEQSAAGQVRDHIAQAQALQRVVKSGPIVAVEPRIPERAPASNWTSQAPFSYGKLEIVTSLEERVATIASAQS